MDQPPQEHLGTQLWHCCVLVPLTQRSLRASHSSSELSWRRDLTLTQGNLESPPFPCLTTNPRASPTLTPTQVVW